MTGRAIVAEFFRAAHGVPRLHALTVIEDYQCADGSVVRSRAQYDVDWCRTYGFYIFDKVGFGGKEVVTAGGLYSASGPAHIKERAPQWVDARDKPPWHGRRTRKIRKRNRTGRLFRLPGHIDLQPGQDLLDWLESEGVQQNSVWCSECNDVVLGDELCQHTWWCEKIGWYSTPSEPCGHKREECES